MYINNFILFLKVLYYNGKKLGLIIDTIKEGKINIIETKKSIPPINFNQNNFIYFNFAPRSLSKHLMGKDFNKLEIMFKKLKKEGTLEKDSFNILMKQTAFFKGFFNHGTYVKNLGNINGENWISVTSTTTSANKIPYDKDSKIIVTKIEELGIDGKELYIGSTVIFTVDNFNILINSEANKDNERWSYEENVRSKIIDQINKLSEEGKIPVINFGKYKESVDLVFSLENLLIEDKNLDELNLKKERLVKLLNEGKPINFNILSKDNKDKINFFKSFIKIKDFSNRDINENTNIDIEL